MRPNKTGSAKAATARRTLASASSHPRGFSGPSCPRTRTHRRSSFTARASPSTLRGPIAPAQVALALAQEPRSPAQVVRWAIPSMPGAAVQPRATLSVAYLCDLLERAGLVTREQRADAVARADVAHARLLRQRTGGPRRRAMGAADGVHPAEVIASMGLGQAGDARFPLTERAIMQALAQHVGLPFVDLDPLKIDAKLAPQLLSRPFARRHGALVIGADERTVTVAVADPLDHALVDALEAHVRREPRLVVATPSDIQRLITDFYGFR